MKVLCLSRRIFALLGSALLAGLLAACPAAAERLPALCVRALDGDSLWVEVQGIRVDVRLIGVDAPEYAQGAWGRAARDAARAWCDEGPLLLEFDVERYDRYRRLLAYAWRDGVMLNERLVRRGLAVAFPYAPNTRYAARMAAAQAEAERAGQGFWAEGGLDVSPAQWRAAKRKAR